MRVAVAMPVDLNLVFLRGFLHSRICLPFDFAMYFCRLSIYLHDWCLFSPWPQGCCPRIMCVCLRHVFVATCLFSSPCQGCCSRILVLCACVCTWCFCCCSCCGTTSPSGRRKTPPRKTRARTASPPMKRPPLLPTLGRSCDRLTKVYCCCCRMSCRSIILPFWS